jgi:membrane associated rhomboid family serine protease
VEHIGFAVLYLLVALLVAKAADYVIANKLPSSVGASRMIWGVSAIFLAGATLVLLVVAGNEMLRKMGAQYW